MENKYYTPEISEFHVGFEFQKKETIKSGIAHHKNQNKPLEINKIETFWNSIVFQKSLLDNTWNAMDYTLKEVAEFIKSDEIRVKYLDRQDIEECGFEYLKKGWGDSSLIFRHPKGFEIYFRGNCSLNISNHYSTVIFEGNVKNKSELLKVFKMLNILQ